MPRIERHGNDGTGIDSTPTGHAHCRENLQILTEVHPELTLFHFVFCLFVCVLLLTY